MILDKPGPATSFRKLLLPSSYSNLPANVINFICSFYLSSSNCLLTISSVIVPATQHHCLNTSALSSNGDFCTTKYTKADLPPCQTDRGRWEDGIRTETFRNYITLAMQLTAVQESVTCKTTTDNTRHRGRASYWLSHIIIQMRQSHVMCRHMVDAARFGWMQQSIKSAETPHF